MARWTAAEISAWADETFGSGGSLARVAGRANEEMAELLRKVTAGRPHAEVIDECADVEIVLCRLVARAHGDLDVEKPRAAERMSDLERLQIGSADDETTAASANVEMALAFEASVNGEHRSVVHYAARCCVILERLVRMYGGDPAAARDAKMAINRDRVWRQDGTGHGYHVRSGGD